MLTLSDFSRKGGKARAKSMSKQQRRESAKKAWEASAKARARKKSLAERAGTL
jgi:hypothetical protein